MKIFCIGFQKTGTSSLHLALERLGYKVCGTRSDLIKGLIEGNDWVSIWKTVNEYDAFEDHPWPNLFKELDEKCPHSKFILTIREENNWIKSCVKFFGDKYHFASEWIYGVGSPIGNEEIYLNIYRKHNKDVIEYFKDRPSDLLIMDLEKGHGWKELCTFLNVPIIEGDFVHINKTDDPYNWYKKSPLVAKILKFAPWLRTIKRMIWKTK
jgi:hypothetical protein